jgi:hypothetical protein
VIANLGRWLVFTEKGRYCLLALALLTAGVIYRHKVFDRGKDVGKEIQRTEQVQGIKQGLDQDRTTTAKVDDAIVQRIAAAETRARNAEARAKQAYDAAQASKQAEQQATTPEQKLTECEGRAAQLETAYDARGEQIDSITAKFAEAVNRYENKAAYTERLEGRFVELWNSHPPMKRSWKCPKTWVFGIGKCADKLKPPPLQEIREATK